MHTTLLWVARPFLALLAYVAGVVIGRPTSGRWLAHYFMSSGRPMRLSAKKERELLWFCKQSVCRAGYWPDTAEADHIPAEYLAGAEMVHTDRPVPAADLYTTIGAAVVWGQDGLLHYLDVYDWHGGQPWSFGVRLGFLPFCITVSGKDAMWEGLGKPFVTSGVLDGDVLAPKNTVEGTRWFSPKHTFANWKWEHRPKREEAPF